MDCENAALAMLDDATASAWAGEYAAWSDFLPGNAADIFPGDAVAVTASSRGAAFQAVVREVELEVKDLEGEHSVYKVRFAEDVAEALAFEFEAGKVSDRLDVTVASIAQVGTLFLPDLTAAEITQVTSTTVTMDSGVTPLAGGGIEVRRTDSGWSLENDRNLVGRFNTRTFTATRLSRVQDYFLRQYDGSNPPKYSRYSAALHVDYPL
jgi:hypothetical protein